MAYECTKCGEAIYIGSRLSEDAYISDGKDSEGNIQYQHCKCPEPEPTNYQCARCKQDVLTNHDLSVGNYMCRSCDQHITEVWGTP